MLYQVVQTGYWLALAVWFGGAVFVALAAGAVFRTLREENPVLPQVLAVNLDGQHGILLGSTIMKHLLTVVGRVQTACAAVVVLGTGLHFLVANTAGPNMTAAILRVVLALAAAGVLAYDRLIVAPRLSKDRQAYIDNADEPETANAAKDRFDRDQQLSLTLLMVTVCLLAGLVLFSAPMTPTTEFRSITGSP